MLSFGDYINWVEPKGNFRHYCVQCGRKTSKNSYLVHVSTSGAVLHPASEADSQGFWNVGRECAQAFDPAVLVKN